MPTDGTVERKKVSFQEEISSPKEVKLPSLTKPQPLEDPITLLEKTVKLPETILTDGIAFWKNSGCRLDKNGYEDLRFAIFNARIDTFSALKQVMTLQKQEPFCKVPYQVEQFGCNLIDSCFAMLEKDLRTKVFTETQDDMDQ